MKTNVDIPKTIRLCRVAASCEHFFANVPSRASRSVTLTNAHCCFQQVMILEKLLSRINLGNRIRSIVFLDSRSRWLQMLLRPVRVGQGMNFSTFFAYNPLGEQSSVCHDVTMQCDLLTLVRTQVRVLDFKRNQRWKLCSTAYPRRAHISLSSTSLATVTRGSLQLDSSDRLCFHMQTGRRHFDQNVLEWSVALKSSKVYTLMLLPVHHEA